MKESTHQRGLRMTAITVTKAAILKNSFDGLTGARNPIGCTKLTLHCFCNVHHPEPIHIRPFGYLAQLVHPIPYVNTKCPEECIEHG